MSAIVAASSAALAGRGNASREPGQAGAIRAAGAPARATTPQAQVVSICLPIYLNAASRSYLRARRPGRAVRLWRATENFTPRCAQARKGTT
jgi:hypothetical protein